MAGTTMPVSRRCGRHSKSKLRLAWFLKAGKSHSTKKGAVRKQRLCNDLDKLKGAITLALGELEGAAGLGLTVLLTFNNAAVAGQEPTSFQHTAQIWLVIGERFGNAVTHSTGLT
jgi:hypothetical protein